jgi:hypothetical protein
LTRCQIRIRGRCRSRILTPPRLFFRSDCFHVPGLDRIRDRCRIRIRYLPALLFFLLSGTYPDSFPCLDRIRIHAVTLLCRVETGSGIVTEPGSASSGPVFSCLVRIPIRLRVLVRIRIRAVTFLLWFWTLMEGSGFHFFRAIYLLALWIG